MTNIQFFVLLGTVLAGVIWQRVDYHQLSGRIDRMSDDMKHFYRDLGNGTNIAGKRPEFPSGMTSGFETTMSSWLMRWKQELGAALADSERCRRSGG